MAMEALIFDMDGLMIDSERLYFAAEREMAGGFGRTVRDETLWKMMGRKPIESMRILAAELGLPATPEELLKMRDKMMRQKLEEDLRPMPGLDYIINALSGRLKLAVATGAPMEFLDIMVDKLGIREKFAVLQSSDDISRGKPDPEIYLVTSKRLGIHPEKCVVLEDSENGALAGKRAGCYVIAVPSEYSVGQDFSFADFVAGDLIEAARQVDHLLQP